ncbi:unnamed protein product, partial [Linum tenue]
MGNGRISLFFLINETHVSNPPTTQKSIYYLFYHLTDKSMNHPKNPQTLLSQTQPFPLLLICCPPPHFSSTLPC